VSEGVEVWCGGVNTWECDEMGHLNVRFWVAKAMEGLAGVAGRIGMGDAFSPHAHATLLVREMHIRYLREARAGSVLDMTAGVLEVAESTVRLLLVIRNLAGEPAATFQVSVAHATARDHIAFPWPVRIRERLESLAVNLPPYAAARGIDLSPVESVADLGRAEALGLLRIGLGAIAPQDADAMGRMRPEIFIGRVSDGVSRILGEERPGPTRAEGQPPLRLGGAVLEFRILHLAWPRVGDRFELRSGFSACEPRIRRLVHWMLDPATGRPWASAEAVVVSFDLDARKVVDISPDAQAEIRSRMPQGLAL
jgi:acyl-CoA thioester hydrolase